MAYVLYYFIDHPTINKYKNSDMFILSKRQISSVK